MRRSLTFAAILAVAAFASPAHAQQAPFVYDAQVTTSPSTVIPANPARKAIEFCNPNAAITVAICPAVQRRTGAAITCAVNGRGSITLPPSTCWSKTAAAGATFPTAWSGVAASGSPFITILEIE
jgi:hypothetical protein